MGSKGFALIECIVTLLLVTVLAAMTLPYMLSGVTHAPDAFTEMNTPLSLQTVMGNIVADYNSSSIYLHDLSLLSANIRSGNYGLTAGHTITKNPNFKFDATDANTSLLVTIRDNATNQSVTYVFTKQL